ncbi:MAG: restriction endonuclease, SacI family [Alphaproteobacteria bacterium]
MTDTLSPAERSAHMRRIRKTDTKPELAVRRAAHRLGYRFRLGVTGRQPLNNQPYFRMTRLDDGMPVHRGSRAAFDYMVRLVQELQDMTDEAPARAALRAFIAVRRRYQPRYIHHEGEVEITPNRLALAIRRLVQEKSEGWRRPLSRA